MARRDAQLQTYALAAVGPVVVDLEAMAAAHLEAVEEADRTHSHDGVASCRTDNQTQTCYPVVDLSDLLVSEGLAITMMIS